MLCSKLRIFLCREEIVERYGDNTKLNSEMSGLFYEIFSRVMKVFVGKKVTIPGSFKRYVQNAIPNTY